MAAAHPIELPPTPLFAGLEQDDWPELLKHSTRLEFGAMEPVFKQGETADAFYVLLNGTVEVRAQSVTGSERPLAHLAPGAVLGETSLLVGGEHSASVYTAEPSTLLMFSKDDFLEMIKQRQSGAVRVLFNIAHTLSVRLRAADSHIAELSAQQPMQAGGNGSIVGREAERQRNIYLTEWV